MLTRIFDYVIQPGDTLFSIGLRFNVTPETLATLNELNDPDMIYAGETLKIPVTEEFYQIVQLVQRQCNINKVTAVDTAVEVSTDDVKTVAEASCAPEVQNDTADGASNITYKRYKVRRGDTVYMLAKEYNTSVGNILALNPQITDVRNLQIGAVITLPVSPPSAYIYVVRPGDTVYKIAQAQGVTVDRIMQYNYLESNSLIYPGQQIVIVK